MNDNPICICGDHFSQHVGEVNPKSALSDCPGFEADPKASSEWSTVFYYDMCTCGHEFCEHEECGNPGTLHPACYGKYDNGTRCQCEQFTALKAGATQ